MKLRKRSSRERGHSAGESQAPKPRKRGKNATEDVWYHHVSPIFEEPISDDFLGLVATPESQERPYEEPSIQVTVERNVPVAPPEAVAPPPSEGTSRPWADAASEPPGEPEVPPEPDEAEPERSMTPEPASEAPVWEPEPAPDPAQPFPPAHPVPQRPFVHEAGPSPVVDPPMIIPIRAYYMTRADDTLRSIAAQFLNTPSRWQELRSLNAAYPGIANAGPDMLLPIGSSMALPGDSLPWGKPDPVYLWTLAEKFLYTAWGREPSPEEVVPFWRGLTSGAKHLDMGASAPPAIDEAPPWSFEAPQAPAHTYEAPPAPQPSQPRQPVSEPPAPPEQAPYEPVAYESLPPPESPQPAFEVPAPPQPSGQPRYQPLMTPAPAFEPMPGMPDLGPIEPDVGERPEGEVPPLPAFMPSLTGATRSAELPVEQLVASSPRALAGTAIGDAMMLWQLGRLRRRGARRGDAEPDPLELSLEQSARMDSLRLVEAAMRHLRAVTIAQLKPKPRVVCVRTGAYGFEVLLDQPVEAPDGWQVAAGGYVLELPRGVSVEQLDAVGRGPSLCPALVPVGDTAEGPLLLNLEEIGCLAVSGPTNPTASLLTSIVETLGSSPLAGDIRIITVGVSSPVGPGWERIHATSFDSPQLEHLLLTAHSPADDGAGSINVLVVGPGNDLLFQRAGQIATAPGSRLVLVGATSSAAARWPWRVHVDENSRAVVHPVAVNIVATQAMRPELAYLLSEAAEGSHRSSKF